MDDTKNNVLKRLGRIEGQVRALQRMVASDKEYDEVVIQIAAVQAALSRAGLELFRSSVEMELALDNPGPDQVDAIVKAAGKLR